MAAKVAKAKEGNNNGGESGDGERGVTAIAMTAKVATATEGQQRQEDNKFRYYCFR